jgi:membrane protein required for colicin V production
VTQLDAVLLGGVTPFAVRGFFRGFCREACGLAGLLGGAFVGAAGAASLGAVLVARHHLSQPWAGPAAFVLLFVATVVAANLIGRLADRLARAALLGWLNRTAGVVFGTLKGATLLGFGLLAAERLVISPAFTERVTTSRFARPLEQLAIAVLETGRALAAESRA